MCSPENKYETTPELPQVDLDFDDPLAMIPSDLRPTFITEHDHTCPDCGAWISEDEFRAHGQHKAHLVTQEGIKSNYNPKKDLQRPDVKIIHKTSFKLPDLK